MDNEKQEIDIGKLTVDEAMELAKRIRAKFRVIKGIGKTLAPPSGRPTKHDYEAWDWTKKNADLSLEHGVNYQYVCRIRRKLGKARVPGGKYYPEALGWDWTKSDADIAREKKVNFASVRQWRRKLGKPAGAKDYKRVYTGSVPGLGIKWEEADWNQPDADVARAMKCTREYVRQKRASLGLPKVYTHDILYKSFAERFAGVKELSHPEMVKMWGRDLSYDTFQNYCQRAGIKAVRKRRLPTIYPWDKMDWRVPNILLGPIWGLPVGKVAIWRSNHPVLGRAAFNFRRKTGAMSDEHRGWVEAQRTLAEQWKVEKDERPCTCHPEDNPPVPCAEKYALSECQATVDLGSEVVVEPVPVGEEQTVAAEEHSAVSSQTEVRSEPVGTEDEDVHDEFYNSGNRRVG